MKARYIIGIDLGTTNSVIAYADGKESENIEHMSVLQLVKAGILEKRPVLSSSVYLPGEHELPKEALALPWSKHQDYCVGEFATVQGARVPNRLVSSAKSWLSCGNIDRKADLLPFYATPDVKKISPVEASKRFLAHLKDSWNHGLGKDGCFEEQAIYLTVPASFDAVARELSVLAAKEAGLQVTLLEEPQAAFYGWICNNENNWRKSLTAGDTVLVVDVGGGTTDLSLISAVDDNGSLGLRRDAVGDHILLGGDNMDLALAHVVSSKLPKAKLDAWQSVALWHNCRQAKEKMLADESLKRLPIAILGRGSSVIGGSLKTEITREDLQKSLLEGFFPQIKLDDCEGNRKKAGLVSISLPYASDPAITRHIARFLRNHRKEGEFATPTSILFNGGVFEAEIFRERVTSVVNSWLKEAKKPPLRVLESEDLGLSVARGAAYFGKAKQGKGIRIRGGTARSYYLGIETAMPAVPGMAPPVKALCVVPHGMEEGTELDVPGMEIGLTVGDPVEFPFFSSNKRKQDIAGNMLDPGDLERSAPISTTLCAGKNTKRGDIVPVKLHSKVTEIGTLEISCSSIDDKNSWNLEFNLRDSGDKHESRE